MRATTAVDKLMVSAVNVLFVLIIFGWALMFIDFHLWRVLFVAVFFAYQIVSFVMFGGVSVGMKVFGIRWRDPVDIRKGLLFSFLYSVSLSTMVFWIYFPFDVLIFNLLFVQLPMILFTGKTLHGFLSGGIYGIKD